MKLCLFTPRENEVRGWVGMIDGDRVVHLAAQSLAAYFAGGGAREHDDYALEEVRLLPPVPRPPSVRDFYELEVAAVVGDVTGRDVIGGFTIMNDWSARDLQRREMKVGLGPAKGKDFATSLGPVVVTPDELGDLRLEMVARVNGEERSRGNLGDMYWSWQALAEAPARNTELRPGDVLGSGTVGTGCILEHGDERWLQPGDEVELEVEGIGVLRNRVGPVVVSDAVTRV